MVVYSDLTQIAILVELTACFEDNSSRKETKYADLVDEIEGNSFTVDSITVEVGARGFVQYKSLCRINELLGAIYQKELSNLLVEVAKVTVKNSFRIWTQRNCWSDINENTGLILTLFSVMQLLS